MLVAFPFLLRCLRLNPAGTTESTTRSTYFDLRSARTTAERFVETVTARRPDRSTLSKFLDTRMQYATDFFENETLRLFKKPAVRSWQQLTEHLSQYECTNGPQTIDSGMMKQCRCFCQPPHKMSSLFFVFVAAGLCGNGRIGAMALLAVPNRIGCRPRTSTTSSSWTLFASTMQQEPQRNNTGKHYLETSLQFVARTVFASDPIPLPKNTTLLDFFMVEGNRNHLLLGEGQQRHTAGPSLPAVEPLYPIPLELWDRWRKEAALAAGAIEPDMDHDTLLRVKSSGIPFPAGMTIFSDSVIGVKLLTGENECPEYQFTLVQDNVRVEGPTPVGLRMIQW